MLTHLQLENFKSWEDTGSIQLKPITGFFGPNSSGKTSLFQALLLMKQTIQSPDRGILFHFGDENALVNLGDFESIMYKHDTRRSLKFSLEWNSRFEFEVPKAYGSGSVAHGDRIGFAVETREENYGSEKSLVLEEMAYWLSDGRRIGKRRLPSQQMYEVFVNLADSELFRRADESNRYSRQSKFHDFPHWAEELLGDRDFIFDLQYGLTWFMENLYHLGPLRANPNRIYIRSGARPLDVGPAGEFVIDALLSSRERIDTELESLANLSIEEYIAQWLKRIGLVFDFRISPLAEGRKLFEVRVRKAPNSAEVLLTDIGFGVSQILPVLVQCFYLPAGSTIVLEQPDIHLHPSVQADLADIFIDAWKKRRVQILFESHSEHLLRRLQRRIAEEDVQQDDVGLFFCSTTDNGASNLSQLELDEFGNISNWPTDFFGDQFAEIAAMSDATLKRQEEAK